jgi:hypothetical protein
MRLFKLSILGMAAISIASAGEIELGSGFNAGTGVSTQGLTQTYLGINPADFASSSWYPDIAAESGLGTPGYLGALFFHDTISGSSLGGSTLPTDSSGYQQFTDPNNGVTFAMMNDPNNPGTNAWYSWEGDNASSSITIPVGVFGTTSANILLNDWWGGGATNPTVTFNFASPSGPVAVTDTLVYGTNINSATACSATPVGADTTPPLCTTFPTTTGANTLTTGAVTTDIAWSASYTDPNNVGASGYDPYAGTSGTVNLADISFNLSGYTGDTLESIVITDPYNCSAGDSTCSTVSSILALSAVDVGTPEPSTVLLLVTGLGVLGLLGRRRMARS